MLNQFTRITLLPLEEDSAASRVSEWIDNRFGRSLTLVVKLANRTSSATYTPKVEGESASGEVFTVWTAAAALDANGTFVYQLSNHEPGDASGLTEAKTAVLPARFRVELTKAGTNEADTLVDAEIGP